MRICHFFSLYLKIYVTDIQFIPLDHDTSFIFLKAVLQQKECRFVPKTTLCVLYVFYTNETKTAWVEVYYSTATQESCTHLTKSVLYCIIVSGFHKLKQPFCVELIAVKDTYKKQVLTCLEIS